MSTAASITVRYKRFLPFPTMVGAPACTGSSCCGLRLVQLLLRRLVTWVFSTFPQTDDQAQPGKASPLVGGHATLSPLRGVALEDMACETWDPYSELGVLPSATAEDIKAAFREKARHSHPDKVLITSGIDLE